MLRIAPFVTVLVMIGPVLAGLWGTVLPALGHFPSAGFRGVSFDVFEDLFNWVGLAEAVRLSLFTGVVSAAASLSIVCLIVAGWSGTRVFRWFQRLLSPLLSVPHAAAAFGIAFLIAPSGWLARLFSPWATGWERPPDILITQDPLGIAMVLGLVAKEVPFLLLMTLAALGQIAQEQRLKTAQSLGYTQVIGWFKTVFPAVYEQIRLPVYVVLAYSMSVVDVAIILGPTTPPPLSVQIVKWMGDPDLSFRMMAAAASLLQLLVVVIALIGWRLAEISFGAIGRFWVVQGNRQRGHIAGRAFGFGLGGLSAVLILVGLFVLTTWSVAGFWAFPEPLPQSFNLQSWQRHGPDAIDTLGQTFSVAILATGIALGLVLWCLEAEYRSGQRLTRRGLWLIYLPLLVPQTAFLPGLQTLLLSIGADIGFAPVVFAHIVFVLPYVFLSLGDPWRAWESRHATVASSLGASPSGVFWRVRLPILLRPVLTAFAVGVAVSVGQYLPTLLIGGGRVSTLTTEALALASGGDRRAIGVYALLQTLAALLSFSMALTIPAIVWRNRRGLSV